jgi:hemolysin D
MKSVKSATPAKPCDASSRFGVRTRGSTKSWRSCQPRLKSWKHRRRRSARTIGATIVLLFCAALVWAWWGMPSGRTKVIQPFKTGVVRSIRVQDGQAVKAGDVLIELNPTVNAAERDHLHNDLLVEELNIARLRAALSGGNDPLADFTPPADADSTPNVSSC